MKKQYVYFFRQNQVSAVKIGLTTDIKRRFINFSSYAPFGAKNIGYIETSNAACLEKEIHKLFSGNKTSGEWFILTDKTVIELIEKHQGVVINKKRAIKNTQKNKIIELIKSGCKQSIIAQKLNTPKSYVSKIKKEYLQNSII